MGDIKISLFTPTYNRESKLVDLYESIRIQTFHDFEWIVIDDGSTDNTEILIKSFIDNSDIRIVYIKQDNRGKHIAQNVAVDIAKGELFLPLDSDDTIVQNALQLLWEAWISIPENERTFFSGVGCHCMDQFGKRIGSQWPEVPFISNDLEVCFKYHIKGEKWGPIRVDIMKEFKNACVKGHFLDESTIWFRIAKKYKKLYIDQCLRIYKIGEDSVQKRTIESEIHNSESKLYANLVYVNEFYDWYVKYDFVGLIKKSMKIVYYASLQERKILGKSGIIKSVRPFLCKSIVVISSPYSLFKNVFNKHIN